MGIENRLLLLLLLFSEKKLKLSIEMGPELSQRELQWKTLKGRKNKRKKKKKKVEKLKTKRDSC